MNDIDDFNLKKYISSVLNLCRALLLALIKKLYGNFFLSNLASLSSDHANVYKSK